MKNLGSFARSFLANAICLAMIASVTACHPTTGTDDPSNSTPIELSLTPASHTVPAGQKLRLEAKAKREDGQFDVYNNLVSWRSSNPTVANVANDSENAGVVTTLAPGTTVITAEDSDSGLSAQVELKVVGAVLTSIEVTPDFPAITQWKQQQFKAKAQFSDGSTADITQQVKWNTSDKNLLTFDPAQSGLATAWNIGPATVTAVDSATGVVGETPVQTIPESTDFLVSMSSDSGDTLFVGCSNIVHLSVTKNGTLLELNATIGAGVAGTFLPTSEAGTYAAIPTGVAGFDIASSVKTPDGVTTQLSTLSFRVKRGPKPEAYVGNVTGNASMTKGELQAQSGIFAHAESEYKRLCPDTSSYSIVSFTLGTTVSGVYAEDTANGAAFSPQMKAHLAGSKPGAIVIFKDIDVQDQQGVTQKLAPIVITVK